jgi:fibronectin type 3 domain-containing protein
MNRSAKLTTLAIALALVSAAFAGPAARPSCAKPPGHSVTLHWQPPVNAQVQKIIGYNVYRRMESGGPYTILASRVPTPTYVDKDVESGKTYYYVVTSVDESGRESKLSQEIRTTVP